jgi:hypothetical protein
MDPGTGTGIKIAISLFKKTHLNVAQKCIFFTLFVSFSVTLSTILWLTLVANRFQKESTNILQRVAMTLFSHR